MEEKIKDEMRLFALETIVCQSATMLFQMFSREFFDGAQRQAMGGARKHVFPGFDAAYSVLVAAEFQSSLERLYQMIQHHLDSVHKRQPKSRKPPDRAA